MAANHGYDYVVCGHIHQPQIREVQTNHGNISYLNSGDWIENLSALEYYNEKWNLHFHNGTKSPATVEEEDAVEILNILPEMLSAFRVKP